MMEINLQVCIPENKQIPTDDRYLPVFTSMRIGNLMQNP